MVTPPVYTIRGLRANLRAAIEGVRTTGVPAIIAERGERPVAVLLDYAFWAARQDSRGAEAAITEHATPQPTAGRPEDAAAPAGTGWARSGAPDTAEQVAIPAGWRAVTNGWGG